MSIPIRRAATILLAACAAVLPIAPQAHADRIVNVWDLCNGYKPGSVPMIAGFTLGAVYCSTPGTIPLQGLSDSTEGYVKAGTLPGLPPGSFRVNPFDPFSDWVIPG
jgi:hypothetical protein